VQQFRADSVIDLCRKVLIAALALIACSMQIALPNRTTFQLPAKRVSSKSPMRSLIDAVASGNSEPAIRNASRDFEIGNHDRLLTRD
jgi:hypothetical protein